MADNIKYEDAFVVCMVKDTEGQAVLDLPFLIYHQTVVKDNRCYYCNIPFSLIGQEVLAFVHIAKEDKQKAKNCPGYLGDKWKDVVKDKKATDKWNITKADAYALTNDLGVTSEYDGVDKEEIVHPYAADDGKV